MLQARWLAATAVRMVRFGRRLGAHLRNPRRLKLGKEVVVGPALRVSRGARLVVHDRTGIGTNVMAMANVIVGPDTLISSSVAFIGDDHNFKDADVLIREQSNNPMSQIILEGDNLVGFGTIIMGNVRIGRGAVVGAGSLVLHDVPGGVVAVGRPARVIRRRGEEFGQNDVKKD